MHGSETWPMKVEHELKMNRTEMSMIRWMCGVRLNERKKSEELRELLGLEPVSLMIKKSRLRWFGHVERKDDNDWVKHCITWEVEGIRPRGRPKKTGWDCVKNDMESLGLSQKDVQSRSSISIWKNEEKNIWRNSNISVKIKTRLYQSITVDPFIQCTPVASDSNVSDKTGRCLSQMAKKHIRRLLERQANK